MAAVRANEASLETMLVIHSGPVCESECTGVGVHVVLHHSSAVCYLPPAYLLDRIHAETLMHTHRAGRVVSVSARRPSPRHTSAASQFCLFKDQAVLLGKWFWRRARSTRISKSLVSHQNRCNFIFSSSSIKPASLSLWPASLHCNNSAKWDRAHELCCFSSTFCVAPSDSPWVQVTGRPAGLSLTHTVQAHNRNTGGGCKQARKEGRKELRRKKSMKKDKRSIHFILLPSKYQILISVLHNYFTCFK